MNTTQISAESLIQGLADKFQPAQAQNMDVVIGIQLNGEGGGDWQIVIRNGTCTIESHASQSPTVTMMATPENFVQIMSGQLDAQRALLTGKLKIKGNMMALMKFEQWFKLS